MFTKEITIVQMLLEKDMNEKNRKIQRFSVSATRQATIFICIKAYFFSSTQDRVEDLL